MKKIAVVSTIGVALLAMVITGCAPLKVKPGAEKIQVITAEPSPSEYEYVGDVYATASDITYDLGKAVQKAKILLRNQALNLGADLVKLDTNNQSRRDAVTLTGRAFKKK